jgi:hypothetical protein
MSILVARTQQSLPDLAERINHEHAACIAAATDAIGRAIEVGRLLTQAKAQIEHGQWGAWVEANCTFGARQASSYMRVYDRRDQIGSAASDLGSLRGALAALTPPMESTSSEELAGGHRFSRIMDNDTESRRRLFEQWWDVRATFALMLDAVGWDVEEIASFLVRPIEDVQAILEPRLPTRFDSWENGLWLLDKSKAPSQLVSAYQALAEYKVELWMELACDSAQWRCSHEGFPLAVPVLAAEARRHRRLREAAHRLMPGLYTPLVADPEVDSALWACASYYDARHAVRLAVAFDQDEWSPVLRTMIGRLT